MRNYKIDYMRSLAILMVIFNHSLLRFAETQFQTTILSCLNIFTRPSIALFCFISGYLFSMNPTVDFFIKRVKRVVFPYLFFSVISVIYYLSIERVEPTSIFFAKWFLKLLVGDTMGIYYFVFVILYLYVLFGILISSQYFVKNIYLFTFLLLLCSILHASYYNDFLLLLDIENSFFIKRFYDWRFPGYWPFFFCLGILFKKIDIMSLSENKIPILLSWIFIIFIYIILIIGDVKGVLGFNSIICTCYSMLTIILLMIYAPNRKFFIIRYLSEKAYYIYLSHIYIVYIAFPFLKHALSPFVAGITSSALSIIIPLIAYYALKLIFKGNTVNIVGA